jgi:nucleoside-diphosphate-sugar epimerase
MTPSPATAAVGRLFCFGLGYTALALATRLRPRGWTIAGTCRSEAQQAQLAAAGIAAHRFERGQKLAEAATLLGDATHLLISVPPDEAGDPVLDGHGGDIVASGRGLRWIGYLSTTGVYGDRGGAAVDEDSELRPVGERGHRRVAAEQGWLDLWRRHALPVHLFRLAAIYGPGRSSFDAIRRGSAQRIVKPGQVFSRAHVADIAAVLDASMARPRPGGIYNVCDDEAAPPQDVVAYACDLLGVAKPPLIPFEAAELSAMARSFYGESKRVDNARIKRELGVALQYPDYRSGLRAILAGEAGTEM